MKRISYVGLVLLLLSAATAWAQSVNVDFDKNADFSVYKTYAWTAGTPVQNPLMDQRIIASIDAQLAARGLTKVDAGANPDLIVLYHGAVTTETQLNTTNMGGWGYRWGGGMSTTTVDKIPIGQLTIDIGDAKTKKLLWLATAKDTLSNNADKNSKLIDNATAKMFKKYPIQPPKK